MKTCVSTLLIVASCLCVSNAYAAYGGGSGTSGDPYLIATPAQLNSIGTTPGDMGSYFKLVANIDMSSYTGTSYNIIGNTGTSFWGGFDGNGYVISNLTYTTTSTHDKVGMFGYTYHATIQNVRLENVNISSNGTDIGGLIGYQYYESGTTTNCSTTGSVSGNNNVGGLVGNQNGSTPILNCYSTATVSGTNSRIGGLIGRANGPVSNCYSSGNVTANFVGTFYLGGLIGDAFYATINNCYSTSAVTGSSTSNLMGGLAGSQYYSSMSNCYSTGTITGGSGNYDVGGLVGSQQSSTATNCYSVGSIYMTSNSTIGGLIGTAYSSTTTASFWDTETSGQTISAGGTGETDAAMKTTSTFTSAGWDFDWSDGTAVWVMPVETVTYPVLAWQPSVYGGGLGTWDHPWKIYTLSQLLYVGSHPADYDKYFILMADINMTGTTYTQAIIAPDTDNASSGFQGTVFTGSFNGNGHIISNLTISDSEGRDFLGLFGEIGIAAQILNLGVENVSINLSGSNNDCIGALVGYFNAGTIASCHSTGTISAFLGSNTFSLGGLVGNQGAGTISSCYSTCSIVGSTNDSCFGGLVGSAHYDITSCYSTGSVYAGFGGTYFGGLAGYHNGGTISTCYSTSVVASEATSSFGGGLVGSSQASAIISSYSTGNVNSDYSGYDIGGLVGYNTSTITNCYARGEVDGDTRVAGLLGRNTGTITNCYSTGRVYGSIYFYGGGLIGTNAGTVTNCFWDMDTSHWTTSAAGTGKTTAEMKTESTFTSAGWDFAWWTDGDTIDWVLWIEGQSYPTLAWQPATFGGGSGTPADPWKIATHQHLLFLANRFTYFGASYLMTADIDMSAYTGTMYTPIGSSMRNFGGTFDGGGHIISNLTYSTTSTSAYRGMFGYTNGATIRNLGLVNELIHSHGDSVGGLIGYQNLGHIYRCFTTGSVTGVNSVGGMVGAELGTIDDSYSTASVTSTGTIYGGAGGLVGVISVESIGVRKCYSAGLVSGSINTGGLIGYSNSGGASNSFWDMETSRQETSAGGTGKTTKEMERKSTFTDASWDFLGETANGTNDYWRMCTNGNYPSLTWEFSKYGDFFCPDGTDFLDFATLAAAWRTSTGGAGWNPICDISTTTDGQIDLLDLAVFANNWLQ
jgi:hypothetical protein